MPDPVKPEPVKPEPQKAPTAVEPAEAESPTFRLSPKARGAVAPSEPPPTVNPATFDTQQFAALVAAASVAIQRQSAPAPPKEDMDCTVPGGYYRRGDSFINAAGQEVEEVDLDNDASYEQPAPLKKSG